MSQETPALQMEHEPRIERRAAQPYLAIAAHVTTEAEFRRAADQGFPELFGWLGTHGVVPSAPLMIRYLETGETGEPLEIELAVPVATEVPGEGRVQAGVLPPGRYATLLHVGPYNSATTPDLAAARAVLRDWTDREGIVLDSRDTERGSALGGCVEHYLIGPAEESDYSRWQTELAYLTTES